MAIATKTREIKKSSQSEMGLGLEGEGLLGSAGPEPKAAAASAQRLTFRVEGSELGIIPIESQYNPYRIPI